MKIHHVSLAFTKFPNAPLNEFAKTVITKMTGNVNFTSPSVTMEELTTINTAFSTAMAAAAGGGKQATATKNAVREELVSLLRVEANYVQGASENDLAKLLSSGFSAASTNTTSVPLNKPVIVKIENKVSTQLHLRLSPVANSRALEMRISVNGNGGWQPAGVFSQGRRIVLQNLIPGTTYNVQSRAVGGSTGYSDWSDPVSHICT